MTIKFVETVTPLYSSSNSKIAATRYVTSLLNPWFHLCIVVRTVFARGSFRKRIDLKQVMQMRKSKMLWLSLRFSTMQCMPSKETILQFRGHLFFCIQWLSGHWSIKESRKSIKKKKWKRSAKEELFWYCSCLNWTVGCPDHHSWRAAIQNHSVLLPLTSTINYSFYMHQWRGNLEYCTTCVINLYEKMLVFLTKG